MDEVSDTLNLSAAPNLSDTVGDNLNGPPTMSTSSAQAMIEHQAKMASNHRIPGQVNPVAEKRPIAQFTGNYEQPPVGNAYSEHRAAADGNALQPSSDVNAQRAEEIRRQRMQQQQMQQQQMYQQRMYQQQMYQQQMEQQQMYQQQNQGMGYQAQQMSDSYGAAFAEIIGTSNNEYECWIDLPGINTEKLSVMVRDNALHVSGERKLHSEQMGNKKGKKIIKALETQSSVPAYLLNKFHFSFPFYKPVDEDNISAEYVNGQLHVILSILQSRTGVKINVKF